jgi:hypothetical protein
LVFFFVVVDVVVVAVVVIVAMGVDVVVEWLSFVVVVVCHVSYLRGRSHGGKVPMRRCKKLCICVGICVKSVCRYG